MEGSAALVTTRLFSSLQLQPADRRLAASVEMYEVARPILRSVGYERTRRISRTDLERYNSGIIVWQSYWGPILQRQLVVDPLAMSVISPFADFVTLTFNAAAFVNYKQDRNFETVSTHDSPVIGGGGGPAHSHPNSHCETTHKNSKRPRTEAEGPRGLNQWEYDSLTRCVKAAESMIFRLSVESRTVGGWRSVKWAEAEREWI